MNLSSIKSRLIIGGTAIILIPLIVSGYLSYKKSYDALLQVSMQQAEGIAKDLARLTIKTLSSELSLASTLASQKKLLILPWRLKKKE